MSAFVRTTSVCTGSGYIGSQVLQHIHQYATLMKPFKGGTALCGTSTLLIRMTGETITSSPSIGRSDRPQAAQDCSSAAAWFGVILLTLPVMLLAHIVALVYVLSLVYKILLQSICSWTLY